MTLKICGAMHCTEMPRTDKKAEGLVGGLHFYKISFICIPFENLFRDILNSFKGVNKDRALNSQREHLVVMVSRDLHLKQPWYHGKIDRNESENRLKNTGHKDGKFL